MRMGGVSPSTVAVRETGALETVLCRSRVPLEFHTAIETETMAKAAAIESGVRKEKRRADVTGFPTDEGAVAAREVNMADTSA